MRVTAYLCRFIGQCPEIPCGDQGWAAHTRFSAACDAPPFRRRPNVVRSQCRSSCNCRPPIDPVGHSPLRWRGFVSRVANTCLNRSRRPPPWAVLRPQKAHPLSVAGLATGPCRGMPYVRAATSPFFCACPAKGKIHSPSPKPTTRIGVYVLLYPATAYINWTGGGPGGSVSCSLNKIPALHLRLLGRAKGLQTQTHALRGVNGCYAGAKIAPDVARNGRPDSAGE